MAGTITMGRLQPDGDGWAQVGGGAPVCRGNAVASRKSGSGTSVDDTITWAFDLRGAASCKVRLFIAASHQSSGFAHYELYGSSSRPDAAIGGFDIDQAANKGQWVTEGPWRINGVLRVQLTDRAAYPGDIYHVTASAAQAACTRPATAP